MGTDAIICAVYNNRETEKIVRIPKELKIKCRHLVTGTVGTSISSSLFEK